MKKYNIVSHNKPNGIFLWLCPSDLNKLKNMKNKENIAIFGYIWCDLIYDLIQIPEFKRNSKKYLYNGKSTNNIDIIANIYYHILNNLLVVNKVIKKSVNNFFYKFNTKPFVGVQIRVGNDDLKERIFSKENDVELMKVTLEKYYRNLKWFLTTDSQKLKLEFCNKYNNTIAYTKQKANHFDKYRNDATIVIEFEILSKSSYMIISKSTFGFTAFLKSGLLKRRMNNLSFLIANSSIHDLNNEFRFVTSTFHIIS